MKRVERPERMRKPLCKVIPVETRKQLQELQLKLMLEELNKKVSAAG